jgi:hypothetical protein
MEGELAFVAVIPLLLFIRSVGCGEHVVGFVRDT